jgi:hypothetical protein
MHVRHRIVIAALLGCGALSGTLALAKTVHLGADAKKPAPVDAAAIAARQAELDAAEQSAHAALARPTPPLPKVPKVGPVPIPVLPPIVIARPPSARSTAARGSARPSATTRRSRPAAALPRPAHRDDNGRDDEKDERDETDHGEDGR